MSTNIQKVFKNTIYYVIARAIPALVGIVMLPIYTYYLTAEDYGIIGLVLALEALLPTILGLKLTDGMSRFFFEHEGKELSIFITTIFFLIFCISLILFIIIYLNLDNIVNLIFSSAGDNIYLFKLSLINAMFMLGNSFMTTLVISSQNAKLLLKTQLPLFFIGLIISIVEIIILKRGALGYIEAILILNILTFIVFMVINSKYFYPKINISYLYGPIVYSLPIIPHALTVYLYQFSDRIILDKYIPIILIGIYVFGDRVASIFKMLTAEISAALAPHYFRIWKNKENSLNVDLNEENALNELFIFFFVISISTFSLFSAELFYILFNENFLDAWIIFPIICLAFFSRLLYNLASLRLLYDKKTGVITIITIFCSLINIILNLIFIPRYGIIAAAITTSVSFFMTYLLAEYFSRQLKNRIILDRKKILVFSFYLLSVVFFSIWFNANFMHFGLVDYLMKILIIIFGCYLGFHYRVFHTIVLIIKKEKNFISL